MNRDAFIDDLSFELQAMVVADPHHRAVNAATVGCMIAEHISQTIHAAIDAPFLLLPSGNGVRLRAIVAWENGDEICGIRGIVVTFDSGVTKQYRGQDGLCLRAALLQQARKGGNGHAESR